MHTDAKNDTCTSTPTPPKLQDSKPVFTLVERQGNLFTAACSLAHCVSQGSCSRVAATRIRSLLLPSLALVTPSPVPVFPFFFFCCRHAIFDADMHMGAGIAVEFKRRFGCVKELLEQDVSAGGTAILDVDGGKFVYYMVTKRRYWERPTYDDLRGALAVVRDHARIFGVRELAMPRIGTCNSAHSVPFFPISVRSR